MPVPYPSNDLRGPQGRQLHEGIGGPPHAEESGSMAEQPEADAVLTCTSPGKNTYKLVAETPHDPAPVPPLLRLKVFCMRTFLRVFAPLPPLLRRIHDMLGALKGVPFRLDPKQLMLMGVAFMLLLALRLRRFRVSGGRPTASKVPPKEEGGTLQRPPVPPSNNTGFFFPWPAARRKLAGAPEISFSEVLELVAADAVEEVHYSPGSRVLLLLKDRRKLASTLVPGADASFFRAVAARVPRFRFVRAASLSEALSFAFPVVLLCLWWRMLRSIIEPLRGGKDTGTDRGLEAPPPLTAFSDVVSKQKHELLEVVLLLNGEGGYRAMGARLPRGVLLVGPAGTGKTLLARAVAGEARVPFLSAAASEFVEVFVGQGARRVREVFQAARRRAPCVLFIDELDALGSRGGHLGASSGHEEYVQTVNQFLMEMDGICGSDDGVVVIGATNRLEAIDPALLRSGRFDRHIHLQLPSAQERYEILKLHATSKKLHLIREAWGHLQLVADASEGFSGADLENLLNESVFRAVRRGRESIDPQALDDALLALLQRAEHQTTLCG